MVQDDLVFSAVLDLGRGCRDEGARETVDSRRKFNVGGIALAVNKRKCDSRVIARYPS